jgi:hypothetical protein
MPGDRRSRVLLLLAFSLSVMGDPISSVAYAIEAALQALSGDLSVLLLTMLLVLAVIALVVTNYHQLVARFPKGGGAAAAAGDAFGEGWSFPPLAALIVDYSLTIAISAAAATSALISFAPSLGSLRLVFAVTAAVLVGALVLLGHRGRSVFAAMTLLFVGAALVVVGLGLASAPVAVPGTAGAGRTVPLDVLLAFPVAMALATGIEAPSSAIAELGELGDRDRVRFGRITLWLTLAMVGSLTIGLTALAILNDVAIPEHQLTLVATVAKRVVGSGVLFGAFQLSTLLLLLAAASSSFQAGPGVLKALAGERDILPRWLGQTNRQGVPYWGVGIFAAVAVTLLVVSGAEEQALVHFYAVAVFVAFLFGLVSMAKRSWEERRPAYLVVNLIGSLTVAATLVLNVGRGLPIVSLVAVALIAGIMYGLWVRAGRPGGVSAAAAGGRG